MVAILRTEIIQDPETVGVRALRQYSRAAHYAAAELWQRTMLPDHFIASKQKKYGYQRRTGKYRLRKSRAVKHGKVRKGGRADLVYSGLMEHLLTRPSRIQAFPTRAQLLMHGPRYVSMVPRGTRPNLGDEATRVMGDEENKLAAVYETVLTDKINRHKGRKTTKV